MSDETEEERDQRYMKLLLDPLRASARYKPMFGTGRKGGVSLAEFQAMYRADPFYAWMGLDSSLMYAAHKAAGGMTSVYRQIGIGGQRVVQHVMRDGLALTAENVHWSYTVPTAGGKKKTLTLDARIDLTEVLEQGAWQRVQTWLDDSKKRAHVTPQIGRELKGAVFEIRQGYKSKDSKRQNADIDNIASAYQYLYLPVVMVLSNQIDGDIAERYIRNRCLILLGSQADDPTESTYAFCREVLGFDLAAFFERNSSSIKGELEGILELLLSP